MRWIGHVKATLYKESIRQSAMVFFQKGALCRAWNTWRLLSTTENWQRAQLHLFLARLLTKKLRSCWVVWLDYLETRQMKTKVTGIIVCEYRFPISLCDIVYRIFNMLYDIYYNIFFILFAGKIHKPTKDDIQGFSCYTPIFTYTTVVPPCNLTLHESLHDGSMEGMA